MPGKRAPVAIRKQRHQFALQQFANGTPYTQVVAQIADQWGCSRRHARDVARLALQEIVGDMQSMEKVDLMASLLDRLERLASKAEADKQYAAAVGAVNSLYKLVFEPHRTPPSGHGHSTGRRYG
jgi:hypothetical protein